MGLKPIIVTGYTPTYEEKAMALVESGRQHDVVVQAIPCADRGSWIANTRIKAEAIGEVWIVGHHVLWLDADAKIQRPFDWDALALWSHLDFVGPKTISNRDRVFYVGTLWFNANLMAGKLLNRWAHYCDDPEFNGGDEWALELACRDLVMEEEPISYGFMHYKWAWVKEAPCKKEEAYVVHGISGNASKYRRGLTPEAKKELGL